MTLIIQTQRNCQHKQRKTGNSWVQAVYGTMLKKKQESLGIAPETNLILFTLYSLHIIEWQQILERS